MHGEELPHPMRRRFQFRPLTLLAAAILAMVLGVAFCYRAHLMWQLTAMRGNLGSVQAMSVVPMPPERVPKDWVQCRFGSLQFHLPPELAKNPQVAKDGSTLLVFRSDTRMVAVALPKTMPDLRDARRTEMQMPTDGEGLSPLRLQLACIQTRSSDFRWSMSPQEVRWFTWRIAAGNLLRPGSVERVETLLRDDLEGLAWVRKANVAFDWQTVEGQAGGYLIFGDQSKAKVMPLAWVRAVLGSLKCTGECFPQSMPKEEVLGQFHRVGE